MFMEYFKSSASFSELQKIAEKWVDVRMRQKTTTSFNIHICIRPIRLSCVLQGTMSPEEVWDVPKRFVKLFACCVASYRLPHPVYTWMCRKLEIKGLTWCLISGHRNEYFSKLIHSAETLCEFPLSYAPDRWDNISSEKFRVDLISCRGRCLQTPCDTAGRISDRKKKVGLLVQSFQISRPLASTPSGPPTKVSTELAHLAFSKMYT